MNSAILPCFTGRWLAIVGCLVAATAFAADATPPADDVASLKARLARAEDKLDIVLRGYTLAQKENDQLKQQVTQAVAARDEAVADTAAAKARVQDMQAQLDAAQKEMAAVRATAGPRDAENARLRELLRLTQDTNAALAAENAQLKTRAARPAGAP